MDIKKYIEKLNKKISKREEDIKDFKESHNPELINVISVYERENDEFITIIAALEKQTPKKVTTLIAKYDIRIGSFVSGKGTKIYKCPCGELVGYRNKFCRECGQKLDWSDE